MRVNGMLLSFSVGNFRSYRDYKTLNMLAAPVVKELESNIFSAGKDKLLKSAVIYGANASGKSNFFDAISLMKTMMVNSSKEGQAGEVLPVIPFLLHRDSAARPSKFELQFLIDGVKYRYGFEATEKRVVSEWLAFCVKPKEQPMFLRIDDKIQVFPAFELTLPGLEAATRENALFISVCAQFNVEAAKKVLSWLGTVNVISGLSGSYGAFSAMKFKTGELRSQILDFIHGADLNIVDLKVDERKICEIVSVHNVYDGDGEITGTIEWDFERFESQGTRKLFALSGLIIDTLRNGETLFVDELDSRLHPALTKWIVSLFNSKETNPKNAQLIFATHDTNLLGNGFRRDQIWFAEKDQREGTDLYSLFDFKGVRKEEALEKNYLNGRYGAIPFLNVPRLAGED